MEYELDTSLLAPSERREAYLAKIDHVLATTFLVEPVHARLAACRAGDMRLIHLEASARRSERTPALIKRDRYDGICFQLALEGHATGEAAGRPVVNDPGTIMMLDFAQPFYIVDQEARTVINISIPRARTAARLGDVRELHGRVLDVDAGAMLAMQMREMAARLPSMPESAAPILMDVLLGLLSLATGAVLGKERSNAVDRRTELFNRAVRFIDSRIGSADLTLPWLLGHLAVSRSELYDAFAEAGGVQRLIWRRRVENARAALLDPNDGRRIREIAFAHGFSSEAHFARLFRTAFGQTASEARHAAKALL